MSAAAPRFAQGTSIDRRLDVASLTLTLAVALLVAGVVAEKPPTSAGAMAAAAGHGRIITGSAAGGIGDADIPYSSPEQLAGSGSNRLRLVQ
jgi:hypothetical protein